VRAALALVGLAALLAACTSAAPTQPAPSEITQTRTVIETRTPPAPTPTFRPRPARSVVPLLPGSKPARGEVEKACPYLKSTQGEDPKRSFAVLEGDRIYRTTVLTRLKPVGCRFYFWAPPFEAIGDIVPRRFATATDAHNAMVLTAEAGHEVESKPDFVHGLDGVLYRTQFFGPDGNRDWAFVFAAGRTMVIVHTQRMDTSLNALLIGRAIARRF
jgi:hypothetical protein